MERVDDRVNDRHDRRKFNAYCGVWRDEDGSHYQRFLLWHPALWWDVLRPGSLWRGARVEALRSMWQNRQTFLYREEDDANTA